MIKMDVAYSDFNDQKQTDTLWFHLSKTRITDHLVEIQDQLEEVQAILGGPTRDLQVWEIQKVLDLVKKLVKLSYGIRSADGRQFRQSEEVWDDFRYSAAYDELLTNMMENPEKVNTFISAIMPTDLVAKAQEQLASRPTITGVEDESSTLMFNPQAGRETVTSEVVPQQKPYEAMSREELEETLRRVKEQGGQ